MKSKLWIAICLLIIRAGYAEVPQPYIVQGTVAECNPIPAPPLPPQPEGIPLGEFKTLPMWSATVTIKRVISGPEQLTGEQFQVNTANHQPEGNSSAIQPKLEVGDSGIFAIQTLRSGKLSMTLTADVADIRGIVLSELPLIKGRHSGYDAVLNRFGAQSSNSVEVASTVGVDSSHVDTSLQSSAGKNAPLVSVEPKRAPESRSRTLVVASLLAVLVGVVVGGVILIKKHRN